MTKVRKKIGTIPINDIEQQVQQSTSAAITQMQQDVSDFIDEETAQYPEIGGAFKFQEDPEGRSEITTDSEGKILSYRDSEGVMYENVGIETNTITLSEDGQKKLQEDLNSIPSNKHWYMPEFGTINIKQETFYLTAAGWSSYSDDVELRQDFEDTDENAEHLTTLSNFYIKGTQTKLDFYRAKEVSTVNGNYYVESSLVDGAVVPESIQVTQVKDVPPYKAWKIDKEEHQCIADIDFGTYYYKVNAPITIKYQGNSTLRNRKRGLRLTFYKKNDYKKKDKVKIGEMLRLSGFNMKSYYGDPTRLRDPLVSNVFAEIFNNRGEEAYPWNKNSIPYNGATGIIKSFPVGTWFGEEFFGLQFFGLKKDEKNYMLDGDDDSSGIFVSGEVHGQWGNMTARDWADEMGVDGRELAYPDWEDSVSVETAAAINEFAKYTKGFMDGTIEIEGQIVNFKNSMLEERIDLKNWIDYWIGCNLFSLWDNTFHNVILYSGADKEKFYLFPYDLDNALTGNYDYDLLSTESMEKMAWINFDFWIKFVDEYKDQILNRYAELRKDVLTCENIRGIYNRLLSSIPDNVVKMEGLKWNGYLYKFEEDVQKIKKRLEYLDKKYFLLKSFNN